MDSLSNKVLVFIGSNPGCNGSAILTGLKKERLSQSGLSRIIGSLINDGAIIKKGERRGAAYFVDEFDAYFRSPPNLRSAVDYDHQFIEGVNEAILFSGHELERLRQAGSAIKNELSTLTIDAYYRFILDLSYSSSKLEGNQYSYLETDVLLQYNERAEGASEIDTQMIINHKRAIEYILSNINSVDIDLKTIRDIHALLSDGMPSVSIEEQGACRKRMISMNGSSFRPLNNPHELPVELERILNAVNRMQEPFNQSLALMGLIPYLQPFVDVNKRVGRLMCNIPLIRNGLAPISFLDMNKTLYTKGLLTLYELKDFSVLKSSFMDGYLRSAPEMVVILNNAIHRKPNPLEFQYRKTIKLIVKSIIENNSIPDLRMVLQNDFDIEPDDVDQVKKIIMDKVGGMHAGALVSFGISPDKFARFDIRTLDIER